MKCKKCGRNFDYDFDVPDWQWEIIRPKVGNILCLPCAHHNASELLHDSHLEVRMTTPENVT